MLPALIETIRFFWKLISGHAQELSKQFSSEVVRVWWNELVAGCYLALVAERCRDPKERKRLRELSSSILDRAKASDGPLKELREEQKDHLVAQARIAAEWFQRSSSCVEGRNGQLSLRHHGLREITRESIVYWVCCTTSSSSEETAVRPPAGSLVKSHANCFHGWLNTCHFLHALEGDVRRYCSRRRSGRLE